MNIQDSDDTSEVVSDSQDLATWNRQRSMDELRSFINRKSALIPDMIDIE